MRNWFEKYFERRKSIILNLMQKEENNIKMLVDKIYISKYQLLKLPVNSWKSDHLLISQSRNLNKI